MVNDEIEAFLKEQPNIIGWLADIAQKEHCGDRALIEALFVSGFSVFGEGKQDLVHIYVNGESESGKSHSQKTVAKFFWNIDTFSRNADKALLYRQYKDRSILFIDDEQGEVSTNFLKLFTTPDETNAVYETVVDFAPRRIEYKHVAAIWRNSVNLPTDRQIMSRFLLFRTKNSQEQIVEYMRKGQAIGQDELAKGRAVVKYLCEGKTGVFIKTPPEIQGHITARQYKYIENLLKAITFANRFGNPNFNAETGEVYPQRADYEILKRIVDGSNLLGSNWMDELDRKIYCQVRDHASTNVPVELRVIADTLGETTDMCRRRLAGMDEYISFLRGPHGKHLYYLGRSPPEDGLLVIPSEV